MQPFADWARQHPLRTGHVLVSGTAPAGGLTTLDFPDGSSLRLTFSGWQVTRVLVSDGSTSQ